MTTLTPSIEQTGTGLRRTWHLLRWNLSRALIVTRREVVDMLRDWRILFPIFVLTILFPFIANWGVATAVDWVMRFGADLVAAQFIPALLMVVGFFPSTFSLVIALESFVGERERRSLEPLLSTPLTNAQLYIGKTLSSTIPPLVGSLLGVSVYVVGVYLSLDWMPSVPLLIVTLLLSAVQALVMVAGAVIISSLTTSVRAANLLASFIIIPMALVIQAEVFTMFWADYTMLWWYILGMGVIAVLLVRMGMRVFDREELLGREIDEIKLVASIKKWAALSIARRQEGPRRSAWQWYRDEVFSLVGRMWKEYILILVAVAGAVVLGRVLLAQYPIPAESLSPEQLVGQVSAGFNYLELVDFTWVVWVFLHNVRTLMLASILASITFGAFAILVLMAPVAIFTYIGLQMGMVGFSPLVVWMALLPHGIFELPAAVIAGAAAIRVGMSIIAPPPRQTVGEAWLNALAEATRLWFSLILPLLLIAAIVEVYITPVVVLRALGI